MVIAKGVDGVTAGGGWMEAHGILWHGGSGLAFAGWERGRGESGSQSFVCLRGPADDGFLEMPSLVVLASFGVFIMSKFCGCAFLTC